MSTRTLLREWLWPADSRSTAEIEAGVREELESHIERMVEERIGAGVAPEEARREAVAHFGDVDRYAAECRRIDLGDRLLVRRTLSVACMLLLATSGYLAWRVWEIDQRAQRWEKLSAQAVGALERQLAASAESPRPIAPTPPETAVETSADAWVIRLKSLRDHMHTAFGVGPDLTLLPPDDGLAIVREGWPQIAIAEVKTGLLKAFAFSKALPDTHARLVQILHLGMTDDDPEIRAYAASYLEEYSHENFNDHPERYPAWYREHRDMTPEALRRSSHPTSIAPPRTEVGARYR